MRTPKSYLSRNKDIVRDTKMLVAAPGEDIEQIRSGTWSTVRFARKLGRPVWVILPNGNVDCGDGRRATVTLGTKSGNS